MTPEELERSKREALRLSDAELGVLLRDGPDGLPTGAWGVLQDEKTRREAVELPDAALAKLLREGPDSQNLPAWEVLKNEEERRERVRAASVKVPPQRDSELDERRYPALRAIVAIQKGIAILVLVIGVGSAFLVPKLDNVSKVGVLLVVGLFAFFQWAAAESLQVIIDIEANTRRNSS